MTDQPTIAARGRVVFSASWCRTCRVCEIACAIGKEGVARPAVARIAISFNEFQSVDPANPQVPITARLCLQCADAPCLEACRVEAIRRDARTGAVVISREKCVGCMRCAKACPWQIPQRHPDERKTLKCDLCYDHAEGPRCVNACPLAGKALRYEPDHYTAGVCHE
jgi:Fe-S-cluster-containing dehydrogenase component